MRLALAALIALFAAAPLYAQTGYVPRAERGHLDDRARTGLGIVVSERRLAFRAAPVEDAVFTVRDLHNAGTRDLAAVGATVWLADLVGGDAGYSDDVPLPAGGGADLRRVYPNPSAAETRVTFSLPAAHVVRLEVLDAIGRHVAVLADGPLSAGSHEVTWDGSSGGVRVGSGLYLVRLITPDGVQTRTVVRLR